MSGMHAIQQLLAEIYQKQGSMAFKRICELLRGARGRPSISTERFSQNDVVLITYADSIRKDSQPPIRTLHTFAKTYLKESFSAIHFLPFFPYSSDDGFSVMDYFSIDPDLGCWDDVVACGADFDLMFDYVLNHISGKSIWFERYLRGEDGFAQLAIEVDPSLDLTMVMRPRALPLLNSFTKYSGEQVHLWTTFSADQIDLNYRSVEILCKMIEVLLFYVSKGARFIRMDAVAYLWKEIGTNCIHLPRTHAMVRLFRKILDQVAPDTVIITETNVPHAENVSYFGSGNDEAQMVYNFTLPPMLLHTFLSGDCRSLSDWVAELKTPSEDTTFFNFTASHDGIGVRPLEGILAAEKINALAQQAMGNGGKISYKQNADGTQSPYELNLTYVDALAPQGKEGSTEHSARFLASQAIQLALPGIPAIYIHSLLGSRNWNDGVALTGRARSINRKKLNHDEICTILENQDSFEARIFFSYCHLLKVRRSQPAFHPNAATKVIQLDRKIFALKREALEQTLFALTNVSEVPVTLSLEYDGARRSLKDLLTEKVYSNDRILIAPYETLWLT